MTIEERSTEVPGLVSDNNSATNASTITSSIAQSGTFNRRGRGRGNQRGGRYQGRSRYNSYIRAPMKGMNNDITILKSTSEGPRKDQFIQFQLELEQYILKEFTSPDDIANIVKDLEDPSDNLNKQMPRIENIKNQIDSQGLDPDVDKEEIKLMKQSIKELYQQEMRLYAGRKQQLRSNKSKLFGTIWSQCTSIIQSELVNLKNYNEKRKNYDYLWLLENLKLLSSGIDSKQNSSYTAFEIASSIYHIKQRNSTTYKSVNQYKL